ncbi:MAG: hypothetical protein ACBR14_10245 [Microcoleus sp.]
MFPMFPFYRSKCNCWEGDKEAYELDLIKDYYDNLQFLHSQTPSFSPSMACLPAADTRRSEATAALHSFGLAI